MLNNSGESGHTCLVSDLRGNAFSFSLLRIKFAVGLSYIGFIMLRYIPSEEHNSEGVRGWDGWMESWCNGPELGQVLGDGEGQGGLGCYRPSGHKELDTTGQLNNSNVPSMPTFWRVFIINRCWILLKAFSASIEMIIWFLIFQFVNIVYHIDWFPYIEESLHSWDKLNLIMMYELFDVLLNNCLLKFCWGFLHLCSSVILAYSFLFLCCLCGFGIRVMVAS